MPVGVQAVSIGSPIARLPMFCVVRPSTSFSAGIMPRACALSRWLGNGSCKRIPFTSGFWASCSICAFRACCVVVWGRVCTIEWMPTRLQAISLFFTYVWLAGLLPTKTTARLGFVFSLAIWVVSCTFIWALTSFPFKIINSPMMYRLAQIAVMGK